MSACDIEKARPVLCTDHKCVKAIIPLFCFMYTNLALDNSRGVNMVIHPMIQPNFTAKSEYKRQGRVLGWTRVS